MRREQPTKGLQERRSDIRRSFAREDRERLKRRLRADKLGSIGNLDQSTKVTFDSLIAKMERNYVWEYTFADTAAFIKTGVLNTSDIRKLMDNLKRYLDV